MTSFGAIDEYGRIWEPIAIDAAGTDAGRTTEMTCPLGSVVAEFPATVDACTVVVEPSATICIPEPDGSAEYVVPDIVANEPGAMVGTPGKFVTLPLFAGANTVLV